MVSNQILNRECGDQQQVHSSENESKEVEVV